MPNGAIGRDGLPKPHPLHTLTCNKHHILYQWKHDLKWYSFHIHKNYAKYYSPVRVCSVCILLARLEVQSLLKR